MKVIQKISILLVILIASQLSYLHARPTGGSRNNFATHSSASSNSNTHAKGGAAFSHNKNQSSHSNAGLAAAGAEAKNSQNSEDSSSPTSTTPTSTTPTSTTPTSPTNTIPTPLAATPTNTPTPANSDDTPTQNDTTQADAVSDQAASTTPQTAKEQEAEDEKDQILADSQTIPSDQDGILNQLKAINLIDDHAQNLLSSAAMDQLFNNFVYFKNFIVNNFPKNKMMSLAIEFINQIYPKEHETTINISPEKSAPVVHDADIQQNHTDDLNQIPTEPEEYPMHTSDHAADYNNASQQPSDVNQQDLAMPDYNQGSSDTSDQHTQDVIAPESDESSNYGQPTDDQSNQPKSDDSSNYDQSNYDQSNYDQSNQNDQSSN